MYRCEAAPTQPAGGTISPSPGTSSPGVVPPPTTPYENAIDVAASVGLQVWLEADLSARWLASCRDFEQGVRALARLARRPSVVGFKIGDEIGYQDGFQHPPDLLAFLDDVTAALHRVAPGRKVLVDLLVPDLGCAPGLAGTLSRTQACLSKADARYPALTLRDIDGYLQFGHLDVVNISTGLFADATYRSWGIDAGAAQRAAWGEIHRRGWFGEVKVQARKALAHPGAYEGGSAQAAADLSTFVDIPLREGAGAVDVWTWRQLYQGQIYRLLDPGLASNALWQGLVERHARGDRLLTHFSPASVEQSVQADLTELSRAFTGVFMAAGIG
jgi:hypothetical protein